MPGFEPEFQYFQNLARDPDGNIVGTPDVPDRSYRPMRQGVISRSQYFDPILQAPQSNAQMNEYRRTLEKLDPGPLDEATVGAWHQRGLCCLQCNRTCFNSMRLLAPFNAAQRDRISELMERGKTMEEAIQNQEFARSKGYDLDGDGVVTMMSIGSLRQSQKRPCQTTRQVCLQNSRPLFKSICRISIQTQPIF